MSKIPVLSLFSGCGGMDLGFEGGFWVKSACVSPASEMVEAYRDEWVLLKSNGFETVLANDILPSAKIVWESNFRRPGVFHLGSIVDLVKKAKTGAFIFPKADVVTGGFPCQDFSVAGKRNGFRSHRNHEGSFSDGSASTMESRGMLYRWMSEVIGIVNPIIFVAENVRGLASLGDALQVISEDFKTVGLGYEVDARLLSAVKHGIPQTRDRIFFIGVRKDAAQFIKPKDLFPEEVSDAFPTVADVLWDLPEPEMSSDPSHTQYSKAKWYGKHCQGQTEVNWNGPGPTIRSEHHGNIEFRRLSEEHGGKNHTGKFLRERRLTPRECARIQTFPDDFSFVMDGVGASAAYKLIGNAVPPLLAYHLARNIEAALRIVKESNHMIEIGA